MEMDGLSSFSPPSVLPDISPLRSGDVRQDGGRVLEMRGPSAGERQHAQQVWSVSK